MPLDTAREIKRVRAREIGIDVGVMQPDTLNSITDVYGVKVGHKTIIRDQHIRTGVTAILPHHGNIFQEKVPASIYVGNAFGKLAGYSQVEEVGNIETPIVLTNSFSVGTAITAVIKYVINQKGNEHVESVNAVIGETNDGFLNDIRGFHVTEEDVLDAIKGAKSGPVKEGSVGAGTGTYAFGFKGGIGTSSRMVPVEESKSGHYTVGVLVQTNYTGHLKINGVQVGRILKNEQRWKTNTMKTEDGSCMVVIATDAPVSPRNLKRIGKRALNGLIRTGSYMNTGSGEYAIAFSTFNIKAHREKRSMPGWIPNSMINPFFQAVIEATEEAVYNSMFMATTVQGYKGKLYAIPLDEVIRISEEHHMSHLSMKYPYQQTSGNGLEVLEPMPDKSIS